MKRIIEEYSLSALGIDQISERISGWLKENHESSKNIARMRLTIEEMLLSMKEHFGEGYGGSAFASRKRLVRLVFICIARARLSILLICLKVRTNGLISF